MTSPYTTGSRILAALAEALMHELDINRRQAGLSLGHLQRADRIEIDDRGCWHAKATTARPPDGAPAEPAATPPTAGSATQVERTDAGWRATDVSSKAPLDTGELVLLVLIAGGRITNDDGRRARDVVKLIGARP